MMEYILVTGGNGYIGSHMCQTLVQKGYHPIIIDSFVSSPNYETHNYGTFFQVDISNSLRISKIIQDYKIKSVIHFAAHALVEESERLPYKYFHENSIKSLQFIQTCIQNQVESFVFSSTCATYGVPAQTPITESTPQNPINSYGMSKLMVEKFLMDMGRHKKLKSVILRYFNVAGSDPHGEIGENHEPETHIIPNLVKAYLDGKNIDFKLFGTSHPTKDGTCIRDYIHVCDLAQGHLQALEYLKDKEGSFQFNLGSGTGSSVLEVIKAFDKVTNSKIEYKVCPARAGDPPELTADISLAKQELNFTNQYNLEDCISHCLNYLQAKQKIKIAA